MANLSLKPKLNLVLQRASTTLRASTEEIKQGAVDVQTGTLTPPPARHRVRRLLFALALPFTLLRLTLGNAEARAVLLRHVRGPIAVFFTIGAVFGLHVVHLLPASMDRPISRSTNALARIGTVADVLSPFGDFETKRELFTMLTPREDRSPAQQRFVEEHADEVVDTVMPVLEPLTAGPRSKSGEDRERAREKLVSSLVNMTLKPDAGVASSVSAHQDSSQEATAGPPSSQASSIEMVRRSPAQPEKMGFWAALLSVAAPLYLLEWVCIWIFREHHDAIGRDVATRYGLPVGPASARPRLRFDLGHWGQKLWRAVRFSFFVIALSSAVQIPFQIVMTVSQIVAQRTLMRQAFEAGVERGHTAVLNHAFTANTLTSSALDPIYASKPLSSGWFLANLSFGHVVLVLMALYWGAVFAIANASTAWEAPPPGWQPWYARVLRLYQRVPVLGWIPRLYAWVLRLATRNVLAPAYAAEKAPIEAIAGLLGKSVIVVPGMYLLVRPFFAPAASHLLAARRAASHGARAS